MRWALAAVAITLGALAPFAGSPYRLREIDPIELATWIKARKPGLRVIDLRSQKEFDEFHIPTSKRLALDSIEPKPGETIVLVCGANDLGGVRRIHSGEAAGVGAATLLLRGGVEGWIAAMKRPSELGRYFGVRRGGGC
ncbi:MAG: rhodanese-like domain-containing protein [Thermoanaerobaculia bacterium]